MDMILVMLTLIAFTGVGLAYIGHAVDKKAEMLRREVRAAVAEALERR